MSLATRAAVLIFAQLFPTYLAAQTPADEQLSSELEGVHAFLC